MTKGKTENDSDWDFQQLIKYGANKEFVEKLSSIEARELVKNILYAIERHRYSSSSTHTTGDATQLIADQRSILFGHAGELDLPNPYQ